MAEPVPMTDDITHARNRALQAFRGFADRGVTNPDDLHRKNPLVQNARHLYDVWRAAGEQLAEEDARPDAVLAFSSLDLNLFFIDAGFTAADYVDEVANDWMEQDYGRAVASGWGELATKIRAKIEVLNLMIVEAETPGLLAEQTDEISPDTDELFARPDIVREHPVLIQCKSIEATSFNHWLKRLSVQDGELEVDLESDIAKMDDVLLAAGLKRSRAGTWGGPVSKTGEPIQFSLSPATALLAQQKLRPRFENRDYRVAQAVFRTVYGQVSAPEKAD